MTRRWVMLHGFTGTVQSWGDVVARLGPDVEARPEPILGHHPALVDVSHPSFDGEVDRLAARVRDRAPGPVEVVGYSMGARLALGLLVRHPTIVTRAWLIGGSAGLSSERERAERRGADEAWARLLERDGMAPFVNAWERQDLFSSQASLSEAIQRRERTQRLSHQPGGLARALRALGLGAMPDLTHEMSNVRVPVSLIAGEADAKFRALAEAMAKELPRATVRIVPGAGHNVVLERPEALASILMEVET
jgi:2-succinyl-6-hydroxy-2,4-cyclohexadiene-1-carboxylate synthase